MGRGCGGYLGVYKIGWLSVAPPECLQGCDGSWALNARTGGMPLSQEKWEPQRVTELGSGLSRACSRTVGREWGSV